MTGRDHQTRPYRLVGSCGPIFSPWIPDDSSILTEKSRTDLFEDFLNFDGPLRNHLFIGRLTSILSIHMSHEP